MGFSDTLQALDGLLEPFPISDFSTELLGVEASHRGQAERDLEFTQMMELASIDTLRKHHIDELFELLREGCTEYFYSLLRVHAGFELSYHDYLMAATGVGQRDLYNPDLIRHFWEEWWAEHFDDPSLTRLSWRPFSRNLADAMDALSGPYDQISLFLEHDSAIVRQSVARRGDLDIPTQYDLVDDASPAVRFELARNKNTDAAVLDELANDLNSIVRRWVAAHPAARQVTLDRLETDPVDQVRRFLEARGA